MQSLKICLLKNFNGNKMSIIYCKKKKKHVNYMWYVNSKIIFMEKVSKFLNFSVR